MVLAAAGGTGVLALGMACPALAGPTSERGSCEAAGGRAVAGSGMEAGPKGRELGGP